MKTTKNKVLALTLILFVSSNSVASFAHSGRTDANGGHNDKNNVSGLGSYHYHHGMGPHLHPNGVCELSSEPASNGGNTAVPDTSYDKQAEKDKGYNQGYSDGYEAKSENPSGYSSSYPSYFSEGYKSGFIKGTEALNTEKNSIAEGAKANGYNDGYSGNGNLSSIYNGKHKEIYTSSYNTSYTEGLNKRNAEIEDARKQGKELGINNGYNKIAKESFSYEGAYIGEFTDAYNKGYEEGELKLKNEISNEKIKAFKNGVNNIPFKDEDYKNPHIKEAAITSYNEGSSIFTKFIKDAPLVGDKLKTFEAYAKDNSNVSIGINNDDDSLVSISDKSKKSVTDIIINLKAINDIGYKKDNTTSILEAFLNADLINSYKEVSNYKRTDKENIYTIYNLKLSGKKHKQAPKRLTIVAISNEDNIIEARILKKETKDIKSLKKVS